MNDNYVLLSKKVVEGITIARIPGRFLMEYFPILRHVPSWFPGSTARKIGNLYKPMIATARNEPYERVEREIVRHDFWNSIHSLLTYCQAIGAAGPSIAKTLIEENMDHANDRESFALRDEIARDMTGIGYAGKSTVCFLLNDN